MEDSIQVVGIFYFFLLDNQKNLPQVGFKKKKKEKKKRKKKESCQQSILLVIKDICLADQKVYLTCA